MRLRVATLSGVMVLGFAVIGAVFQTGRHEVDRLRLCRLSAAFSASSGSSAVGTGIVVR